MNGKGDLLDALCSLEHAAAERLMSMPTVLLPERASTEADDIADKPVLARRARRRPGSFKGREVIDPFAGQLPTCASTSRRRYLSASERPEFLHLQANTSCRLGITKMLSLLWCPIATKVSAGADGQPLVGLVERPVVAVAALAEDILVRAPPPMVPTAR